MLAVTMDRRFLLLTGIASAVVFAGTWTLAGPRASASAAPSAPAVEASVYFAGCDEARTAGAAPIYRGQPGYRPEMDGDGDGIACEPHRGHGFHVPHFTRGRIRL